jgi:hypothetical protein
MSTAVALAVMGVTYFQSGAISWLSIGLIFPIALCATFLLYVPVEYHNIKTDQKRAALSRRARGMS